jgi:hypothetical protein
MVTTRLQQYRLLTTMGNDPVFNDCALCPALMYSPGARRLFGCGVPSRQWWMKSPPYMWDSGNECLSMPVDGALILLDLGSLSQLRGFAYSGFQNEDVRNTILKKEC